MKENPRFSWLLEAKGKAKPSHTYNKIEKKNPRFGAMCFLHFSKQKAWLNVPMSSFDKEENSEAPSIRLS
jgi:hypothetical protein